MQHTVTVTYSKGFNFLPVMPLREKVERLQEELLKMPQADVQYLHSFEPGKYIRTMIAPPWTVIVGAEHKTSYRIRLEKGTIAVNIDDEIKVLTAPLEFDAPAGVKRVGRVFDEEVIWVDYYDNPDDCRDIQAIEERLYVIPECGLMSNRVKELENKQNDTEQLTNSVKMLLGNGFGFNDMEN